MQTFQYTTYWHTFWAAQPFCVFLRIHEEATPPNNFESRLAFEQKINTYQNDFKTYIQFGKHERDLNLLYFVCG